jgi:hypothetical protein
MHLLIIHRAHHINSVLCIGGLYAFVESNAYAMVALAVGTQRLGTATQLIHVTITCGKSASSPSTLASSHLTNTRWYVMIAIAIECWAIGYWRWTRNDDVIMAPATVFASLIGI